MGSGTPTLQTIPVQSFQTNPGLFFQQTVRTQERIEQQVITAGGTWNTPIPQVGVIQKLRTVITGTITIASGGATPTERWPHGLLEEAKLSANGQNDLHSLSGIDLHVLRFCRFPAYEEAVDTFPGTVGGGPGGADLASIAAGTYNVHLTFEHPVAADESTLVGAIFAQSSAANINLRRKIADLAALFGADASKVTLNLTAYTHEVRFEIPIGADGALIVPDLSRLMAINSTDKQFSSTGAVEVPMVRSAGQLHRLIATVRSTATKRLVPSVTAAANSRVDAARLVYGGNKRPLDYDPISDLMAQANNWYGSIPPYDAIVLDLVRENPQRDLLLLQGVTELKFVPTVNAAVSVGGGTVHMVQQTLFAGG
jgi:hypothetical protein